MNEKIDMVSLPKKSFWHLSIPIIAFCIFDAIYGIVDLAWVSQINVHASFAVSVSIPFVTLIFSFGDSIGQGANSMMSRFMGVDDYESAYNTLIHGIILTNIIWILIVLCAFFTQGVLYSVDSADSYVLVWDYLIPIVTFAYVFMFVNFFSETLQAEGNSRIPTLFMIASNVLNIILDPIFIFNLNLGVKGASYATVLSALIPFIVFVSLYLSGKTKIPLSMKYFKFRPYIIVEILKVSLPNFLDDGLWAFSASFINGILIVTMGDIGPVLYSASNKLKTLLSAPIKGYGRALMSVTGHLFGAHEFDELNEMYKYALKVSFMTTVVVMIAFILLREFAFSFFSITGMKTEIFWIAILGTVILLSIPFSIISSKMLDGFGKSMYSLLFTVIKILLETALIYVLNILLANGSCVLIGITTTEIIFAIVYYVFLRYLFKNFDEKYENKEVVKTFKSEKETAKIKEGGVEKYKTLKKILLNIALIVMTIGVIYIVLSPISFNNYPIFLTGIASLVVCTISIYLITKLNKPILSLLGFMIATAVLFIFMHCYGNESILWFVIAEILIVLIIILLNLRGD
ncbi:MATE family efflux transporter [Methanobrevibacter sp.]|uniref:MATE family efflux transporter n=1 Tax=Methanobrevibacter sp. TaxID=66852 RepID=UPI00388F25B0